MANYAILNSDNVVENLIVWDGKTKYTPPVGKTIIPAQNGKIGDTWNGQSFVSPQINTED